MEANLIISSSDIYLSATASKKLVRHFIKQSHIRDEHRIMDLSISRCQNAGTPKKKGKRNAGTQEQKDERRG